MKFSLHDRLAFNLLDRWLAERRDDIFEYPEILRATYANHYPGEVEFYAGMIAKYCGPSARVVELASGWGRIAGPLAGRGFHVIELDRSLTMLRASSGPFKINSPVEAPPFRSQSADAFLMPLGILNSLAELPPLISHFQNAAEILKPGGLHISVVSAAADPRQLLPHRFSWSAHSDAFLTRTDFSLVTADGEDASLAESIHRIVVRSSHDAKPAAWRGRSAILTWKCAARIFTPELVEKILAAVPSLEMVGWFPMFHEAAVETPRSADGASVLILRKRRGCEAPVQ